MRHYSNIDSFTFTSEILKALAAEIWLIHPKSEKFNQRLSGFRSENNTVIKVLPFDMESSSLLGVSFV